MKVPQTNNIFPKPNKSIGRVDKTFPLFKIEAFMWACLSHEQAFTCPMEELDYTESPTPYANNLHIANKNQRKHRIVGFLALQQLGENLGKNIRGTLSNIDSHFCPCSSLPRVSHCHNIPCYSMGKKR